jgi:PEP-CTERM motif
MKTSTLNIASTKSAILALGLMGLAVTPAQAVNPNFAAGDLILYFEQFGGTNTLMLDLGAAWTYRGLTTNLLNIANIGGSLSGAFTPTSPATSLFDDPTLFWGIAACRSASISTVTATNGDPNRTLYASQARTGLGTVGTASSSGWGPFADGAMAGYAGNIIGMAGRLGTVPAGATDRLVEPTSSSLVDNQNPINIAGNPTTAFGVFTGGVMSSFGAGNFGTFGGVAAESALDFYRILPNVTTATGQVAGTPLTGDYQGTFVIDNTGSVSFIVAPVPEPATVSLLAAGALLGLARRRRAQRA